LSNIAVLNTAGPVTTIAFNGVPAGTYYVRLRAVNAFGAGITTTDVMGIVR
jgi:hypothetical protein